MDWFATLASIKPFRPYTGNYFLLRQIRLSLAELPNLKALCPISGMDLRGSKPLELSRSSEKEARPPGNTGKVRDRGQPPEKCKRGRRLWPVILPGFAPRERSVSARRLCSGYVPRARIVQPGPWHVYSSQPFRVRFLQNKGL